MLGDRYLITGLFADVVLEENHFYELVITENLVEKDSAISNYCYKASPEVTMKIDWSESIGKMNGLIGNFLDDS